MTRNELKRRYPNASEAFLKKNLDHGVASDAEPESNPVDEPLAAQAGAGSNPGFRFVILTSYRLRLLDHDNCFGKYFVDCLVRAGLLREDSPRWCKVQVAQILVENPAQQRTQIEIFEEGQK